jgi:hypothetical protein
MENIEEEPNINNELGKLNDDWIHDLEKNDKLYQDFYKDNVYYINIHCVYINKESEIDKIKTDSFLMSQINCITREEIIGILKHNTVDDICSKQYSLLSILKYNISLDIEEVVSFLRADSYNLDNYNNAFLTSIKNIDTIYFDRTIHMFQDLNDLFIIYYEKTKEKYKENHSITKKIFLKNHSMHKKTIRKQYKE